MAKNATSTAAETGRRSQAERRESTRAAIAAAAEACLVESGLDGFKTARVASRAGVSEGSIFRYHPTKADLLATVMEKVFADLRDTYEERFAEFGEGDGPVDSAALVQMVWELMGDRRLLALLELLPKARTDDQLRDALKPVIARHRTTMHSQVRKLFGDVPVSAFPLLGGAVDTIVLAMQGMRMHDAVVRNPAHVKSMLDYITLTLQFGER